MLSQILRKHNYVVRTSTLREAGITDHAIRKAVATGHLQRVSRGWVATSSAEPDLVRAAFNNLTLSCVTQATRLGLWVRDPTAQHFAVPKPGSERRTPEMRLHYRTPLTPRSRHALADSLIDTLVTVAECQPFEDAVACWDSALNKRLISRAALGLLPLRGSARRVLLATNPFADSGLETYLRLRLRWLRVPLRAQVWIDGHRVDLLVGDRLVLQVDGGHHVGEQRDSDNLHDARLRQLGYEVIRVSYTQVMHRWQEVHDLVTHAVAMGLHHGGDTLWDLASI